MRKKHFSLLILIIFTLLLFTRNKLIHESIIEACTLFLTKVFPSLFPILILCDLFIYFEFPELLCHLFGKIFEKLFHTSAYGAFAFFMSLFSGTPANAYIIKNLVFQNKLTIDEASYIFSFSFFTNPLFLYTMLKLIFPNNPLVVAKIFIAPYITNFIIGIIKRPSKKEYNNMIFATKKKTLSNTLIQSIKNSMNTMLMILGTITFFYIINSIINPHHFIFINGILEVSQGLNNLINSSISLKIKELFTLIFISFGGLSIHLQIRSILENSTISFITFFKTRLLQCLLSIIWVFL